MQRDEAIHRLISPSRSVPDSPTSPAAIFLSYAREDAAVAQRLAEALRSSGIEVWFDQSELRGGDAWDQNIRRQIKDCALFLPVISAHTQARGEGYFRLEWKLAVERTHLMAEGVPFLAPVVIDDTTESAAAVPAEFLRVQWTRLARGLPSAQFVEQITRLLAQPRTPGATRSSAASTASNAPRAKSGTPTWVWATAVIAVVGVIAFFATRKPEAPAAPAKPIAETKSAPAAPAAPVVSDKSIAVLPFANMSEDKDANAFFADGIHEEILTNLALISELRVISRTSVEQYRKTTKPLPQIARELGVAWILEGSVFRAGNKVRVTGQLIRAATDEHAWAKSYSRDLTDIFAIQAELAQSIAGALQAAISPQEKNLLERRPTENLAAYDLFLKSNEASRLGGITAASNRKTESLLESAVSLDPKFAIAWSRLSLISANIYFLFQHTPAQLAKAEAATEQAKRLAPDSPETLNAIGGLNYRGYRDYAHALEFYEKARHLAPNLPRTIADIGQVQRRQGKWAESTANAQRAVALDPGDVSWLRIVVQNLRALRRFDEAIAAQRRVCELVPESLQVAFDLAYIHFTASGSTREVEKFFAELPPLQAESPEALDLRKTWARARGEFAEAIRLDRAQPNFDGAGVPHWQQAMNAALTLAAQGDRPGARARLENFSAELRSGLEVEPTDDLLWSGLARIEMLLDHAEEAMRYGRKAVELLPESLDALAGTRNSVSLASVYAWTGDKDRAIAEVARLLRTPRGLNVHELKFGPEFFPLRGDPRFEALLNDPKNNAPLF